MEACRIDSILYQQWRSPKPDEAAEIVLYRRALEHDLVGTPKHAPTEQAVGGAVQAAQQRIAIRNVADVLRDEHWFPGATGDDESNEVGEIKAVVEVNDVGASASVRQAAQRGPAP